MEILLKDNLIYSLEKFRFIEFGKVEIFAFISLEMTDFANSKYNNILITFSRALKFFQVKNMR